MGRRVEISLIWLSYWELSLKQICFSNTKKHSTDVEVLPEAPWGWKKTGARVTRPKSGGWEGGRNDEEIVEETGKEWNIVVVREEPTEGY